MTLRYQTQYAADFYDEQVLKFDVKGADAGVWANQIRWRQADNESRGFMQCYQTHYNTPQLVGASRDGDKAMDNFTYVSKDERMAWQVLFPGIIDLRLPFNAKIDRFSGPERGQGYTVTVAIEYSGPDTEQETQHWRFFDTWYGNARGPRTEWEKYDPTINEGDVI